MTSVLHEDYQLQFGLHGSSLLIDKVPRLHMIFRNTIIQRLIMCMKLILYYLYIIKDLRI
mgnify:FL=1|jgi:hypothetical protein